LSGLAGFAALPLVCAAAQNEGWLIAGGCCRVHGEVGASVAVEAGIVALFRSGEAVKKRFRDRAASGACAMIRTSACPSDSNIWVSRCFTWACSL
jgi:hypothetical protein